MKRVLSIVAVALVIFTSMLAPQVATAEDSHRPDESRVHATEGSMQVWLDEYVDGMPGRSASKPVNASGRSPGRSTSPLERRLVPTCSGNGPDAFSDVCEGALTTCPDPAKVQFWVFVRAAGSNKPWGKEPGTLCLSPADPAVVAAVDPAVLIPAIVDREFKRVVVLKAVPVVQPLPDTLVRFPTRFATNTARSYDIPLTLLGQSVVITATAASYTWQFGDGTSTTITTAAARTEHSFSDTGSRTARVDITWTGTFRINGGPAQDVTGTATTTGQPVTLQVKQARSELIAPR